MFNSKIIQLLSKLSTRECSRFREYVHSPYFNKHKVVKQLVDYLLSYAPSFESPALDKKEVFAHLFPQKTYNETTIYTYTSNLLDLFNDFLAQEELAKEPMQKKLYSIRALQKLEHPKQFKRTVKQHLLLQKKYAYPDNELFFQQYLFHEELNINFLMQPRRQYDSNLQQKNNALDLFYLETKLKTACDMLSRNAVIQANYESWGIDQVVKQIEECWDYYQDYPSIVLNYQILQMLQNEDISYYNKLKVSLQEHLNSFSKVSLQSMYDYAINYCIRQLNTGNQTFYREFFDLHRILLEQDILTQTGHLSEWDYTNIATVGIKLQEFEWVENFIQDYKQWVAEDIQENAFVYNLAFLYYSSQRYKDTLSLLHEVNFSDSTYYLRTKIIQLKSYYALGELDTALSLIAALQSFLNRNKDLPAYMKSSNGNMAKMAKKLIKLELDKDFLSAKKLAAKHKQYQQELDSLEPMVNPDWLKSILNKL
ncbi:MAG: hypothetical protein GY810_29880 [Aureispira sp.]|nr:hypothetical protein [Aureispira sp.]